MHKNPYGHHWARGPELHTDPCGAQSLREEEEQGQREVKAALWAQGSRRACDLWGATVREMGTGQQWTPTMGLPWPSPILEQRDPHSLSGVDIDRLQFLAPGGSSVWKGGDRTLEAVGVARSTQQVCLAMYCLAGAGRGWCHSKMTHREGTARVLVRCSGTGAQLVLGSGQWD